MNSISEILYKYTHVITLGGVGIIIVYFIIMFSIPSMTVRKLMYKIFIYAVAGIIGMLCFILFMWIIVKKGF